MSAVSKSRPKRSDPLDKKIPENPKYKHVKSTIDTGSSMTRYLERIEEIRKNYRFQKNELFKRMKITTFVQLLIQVADYNNEESYSTTDNPSFSDRPATADTEADLEVEGIQARNSPTNESGDGDGYTVRDTARSTLQEVIKGVGEVDVHQETAPDPADQKTCVACPYLLLDMRDPDDFNKCHIISSYSYPMAMLSRATNYESKELLAYKNQPGKIIIIYDNDEMMAPKAATTFVERGYDNLFMLSGGLKVAYKVFPDGLFTGTVPFEITEKKCKTDEPVIPANQDDFTCSDLDKLNVYLDSALQDRSSSSRLSKASASRMGNVSKMSAKSNMSSASSVSGRPPFR